MLLLLSSVTFLSLSVLSGATSLSSRASVQSNATCGAQYFWLYNHKSISPCWLAAAVTGPCQQGDFNVAPLQPDHHYDPPINATATRCLCSWAAYNLYSACTACQGEVGILSWPVYSQDCPSDYLSSTTYWPANFTITGNNELPYYAGTNPSTWADQRFNVQQAMNITNQQHPDLTGVSPSPTDSSTKNKSGTPVGAIAGGVVGGVAVLVLGALTFWYLRRKRNATKFKGVQELDPGYQRNSFSEVAHKPLHNPSFSYAGSTFPTSTHPASPTVYTHNESVHSFSQFGSVSAFTTPHSPLPSRYVTSPAPTMQTTFPTAAPEDHIQPFLISPTHLSQTHSHPDPPVTPRKGDLVVLNPTQRIPGPPVNRDDESVEEGAVRGNGVSADPPAYTQYPGNSESSSHNVAAVRREQHGHGHRPYPAEKGNRSQDMTQSSATSPWTSVGSGETINNSATSSTVPFGISAGEFGQIRTPQRSQTRLPPPNSGRSVIGDGDQDEHVEVA
ncbi:hypothetical protein E1B28_002250 [Marasmius oreades]|uniref:Uncharacterized protein n=1 Tax=Marasmius oreades TaxID=181124 RepID=A0A9P7RN98_9AGAR|nr:uncharacterized protein E1B28_002250 [Marasmius oreades]KAG7086286.1 hypothetical protein E1B28_002250 [Marasmius oreades]